MPTRQFVENVLKLSYNFAPGEDFSSLFISSAFASVPISSTTTEYHNIIVKHSYEDLRVICLVETALKSRCCSMLTITNLS
jgi:hypothetical protein